MKKIVFLTTVLSIIMLAGCKGQVQEHGSNIQVLRQHIQGIVDTCNIMTEEDYSLDTIEALINNGDDLTANFIFGLYDSYIALIRYKAGDIDDGTLSRFTSSELFTFNIMLQMYKQNPDGLVALPNDKVLEYYNTYIKRDR